MRLIGSAQVAKSQRWRAWSGRAISGFCLLGLALTVPSLGAVSQGGHPPCEEYPDIAAEAQSASIGSAPSEFEVVHTITPTYKSDGFRFLFGRHRFANFKTEEVSLDIPDGQPSPPRGMEVFVRVVRPELKEAVAEDKFIGRANIIAVGKVGRDQETLDVTVCIDTVDPVLAAPGSYEGAVSIEQDGFDSIDIPVKVSLQNQNLIWPFLFVVFAGAGAGVLQWWLSKSNLSEKERPFWSVRGRKVSVELIFGVVAGIGAGVTLALIPDVLRNPAWVGDFDGLWKLGASAAVGAGAAYPVASAFARQQTATQGGGENEAGE